MSYKLLGMAMWIGAAGLPEAAAAGLAAPARQAVPLQQVQVAGGFWGKRLDIAHEVTAPHVLDKLEEAGHVTNFDKAAGRYDGPLRGHHAFDSDVHKGLEGAIYSLHHRNDPALRSRVEAILDRILAAQQDDGFLISCYIVQNQDQRWDDLRLEHQLYNAGHFFEMAVAHYQLTGRPKVLEAARRFADHIDGIFGPGKRYDVDGHPEVELALVKLYRATGERRYLELTRFFLDERGHAHGTERKPFDPATVDATIPEFDDLPPEERVRARRRARYRIRNGSMQDHKPLLEQDAVGHAVRAGYIYSAMADIALLIDAPEYDRAVRRLARDVAGRHMYLTGGIGTNQYGDEGFGDPYRLPNESAYCESCAAIAHVLWQHRMNLLTGEARHADLMEWTLYNGVLSGISLAGDAFFYQNPLASNTGSRRRSWIGLACCPTNLARIIPQVGGFVYVQQEGRLDVNLYLAGTAALTIDGADCRVEQETAYPWDGRVTLRLAPEQPREFDLCLRVPGWAQGRPVPGDLYQFADAEAPPLELTVNGTAAATAVSEDGYLRLSRRWQAGDVVELNLPMTVRRVYAHPNLVANRGKVALMRGPLVYCLEAADHPETDVLRLALPRDGRLDHEHREALLGGVTVLRGRALTDDGRAALTAIPYYAWANRRQGPMTVWINEPGEPAR